jgi:hypothetical protein
MKTNKPAVGKTSPKPVLEGTGVIPDLHLATWMKEEVRYISDQDFHLVLYVAADLPGDTHPSGPFRDAPRFKNPSQWKFLFHQTAGYACHHRYLHAKFLRPKPAINKLGKALLAKYNDSLLTQPVSLSTAVEYNSLLETFGVNADRSYTRLEEGFYPIDIECLPKVTTEKFSKDLRKELIKSLPKYKKRSVMDVLANWVDFELAILGPNCD